MEEPSVLDYVKSRLMPWKYPRLSIPEHITTASPTGVEAVDNAPEKDAWVDELESQAEKPAGRTVEPLPFKPPFRLPWRSLAALLMALAAQWSLSPGQGRSWQTGVILLAAAVAFLGWAYLRDEWRLAPIPAGQKSIDRPIVNLTLLLAGLACALIAFWRFSSLQFKFLNTGFLFTCVLLVVLSFRNPPQTSKFAHRTRGLKPKFADIFSRKHFSWHGLGLAAAVLLAFFFRFSRLGSVPPEMNSDHAEKILDVLGILAGQTRIFFPSNGGREGLQFYLVAGLHKYFHIPLGYDILKLVTAAVGFLALPFIYWIGKEIGNRRVGLMAFTFAGIAYWPNVVSRVGMRLPFYIFFTAATIYFLLRGIQRGRRRDYILAGISLGLSFYGYSADRILPLCVLIAIGLFLIHRQSTGQRRQTIVSTLALVLITSLIFLPLLRYMLAEPEGFFFRTLTRMGSLERPLPGPAGLIFLGNLWNALKMFSWSGGVVWPISIPDYPALGFIAGGLFYLGAALLLARYLRQRHWMDLFLLLSIPVLMLPSILSLAFPAENPNLYRTGGVVVPAFLMVGMALDGLMTAFEKNSASPAARRLAWGLAVFLLFLSTRQEYDWVFNKYFQQYRLSAWNSSEMGQAASHFIGLLGNPETVWVVGYPHWVDTRLVALNAGFPGKDFQIFPEQFDSTRLDTRPKLFMLNPQDETSLAVLMQLYPHGWSQLFDSKVETKDFILFFVPPELPQSP